jgi:hypothetical protein
MNKLCVWVHEVAVLTPSGKRVACWEVWDTFNTRREAVRELRQSFKGRPDWVTAKFHKTTNRIRKYIPASAGVR